MIGGLPARALALLLCFLIAAPATLAADLTDGLVSPVDVLGKGHGSEYVSGDHSHPVLMQINLWGGVTKPGIHYVPVDTDLITLLSYAGGPVEGAKLDKVVIKRKVMVPAASLSLADLSPAAASASPSASASAPDAGTVPKTPAQAGHQAAPPMEQKEETLHVNLEDFMNGREEGKQAPTLQANDIVLVPVTKPAISNNTVLVLSVLSTLASIVLAGAIVSQSIHK